MSFDWSEYLNLAQELAGQVKSPSSQEAKLRSSISRSYYAAFCKARNNLRGERHSIPRQNTHRYVIDQFLDSPDRVRKRVGAHLDRLRKDRNKADYDDKVARLSDMTAKALRLADQVILRLGSL
jgi:uncharacterized protein (UPF0332 family)